MEEGSKRRLVGTAVVVLLLVIFLPMLLEEEPTNPVPDSDLEIAEQPAFGEEFDPDLAEPAAETFALPATPDLPQPDSYQAAAPEPKPAIRPRQPPVVPPFAQPATMSEPRVEPEPAKPEPEPEPEPDPPPASVAIAPPAAPSPVQESRRPKSNGPGWVIQVSSLTEKPRALSLERDLRAKGFPVFIERAEVGGKIYHRVRVGPRSARQDIEAMAASLLDKAGHKGQILRYP